MRVAVCGSLAFAAGCGGGAGRTAPRPPEAGAGMFASAAPLESLTWPALRPAGVEAFDPATLHGRWVLVQAMTTSCAPCDAQLADAQAVARRFDLTWIVLLLDAQPERVAPRFAETYALDATLLLAPPGARTGALPLAKVEALPEYWLVDPTGQVRGRFSGFLPVTQVEVLLAR